MLKKSLSTLRITNSRYFHTVANSGKQIINEFRKNYEQTRKNAIQLLGEHYRTSGMNPNLANAQAVFEISNAATELFPESWESYEEYVIKLIYTCQTMRKLLNIFAVPEPTNQATDLLKVCHSFCKKGTSVEKDRIQQSKKGQKAIDGFGVVGGKLVFLQCKCGQGILHPSTITEIINGCVTLHRDCIVWIHTTKNISTSSLEKLVQGEFKGELKVSEDQYERIPVSVVIVSANHPEGVYFKIPESL